VASGAALQWLRKFHAKLKADLLRDNKRTVLTYSPIADWFANEDDVWVQFIRGVKDDLAWLALQFYDGGKFNWTTADVSHNG